VRQGGFQEILVIRPLWFTREAVGLGFRVKCVDDSQKLERGQQSFAPHVPTSGHSLTLHGRVFLNALRTTAGAKEPLRVPTCAERDYKSRMCSRCVGNNVTTR